MTARPAAALGAAPRFVPWAAALLLVVLASGFSPWDRRLPRLVFVSRHAAAAHGAIPGVGPAGRTLTPGGELLVRERGGRVHALLEDGAFLDVADPSVSWDGRRIAFAATPAADAPWRIWIVDADGRNLRRVTEDPEARPGRMSRAPGGGPLPRADDFDPCWLPDGGIVFASTRLHQVSERGHYPVSNLFAVREDGTGLHRITTDRNGAEAPGVDPRDGRIVYARWWFNRFAASDVDPMGIATSAGRAVPADTVNLWHAVSILTDGDGIHLAGGDPRDRHAQMAYQPIVLRDGTLVGVIGPNASLEGAAGRLRIVEYRGGFATPRMLTDAPCAVAPAPLPDGRLLCAVDMGGNGDFGLYVLDPAHDGAPRLVFDRRGTLELDAVMLAPRKRPPVLRPGLTPPALDAALEHVAQLHDNVHTFRFDCLNVFANAPVDAPFPDAPPLQQGVRIRFFATLARPFAEGGDTLVLVREAPVTPRGGVHEDGMPADVPMFEQLVDARGHVLRSGSGPAHVPGFNYARFGSGTKCVGCHAGHSAITVPINYSRATWVNASPSAEVTASSVWPGTGGARAAVDRRTRGSLDEVAWQAATRRDEWLRLTWRAPIEVAAVVLYPCRRDRALATDSRIGGVELRGFRGDSLTFNLMYDNTLDDRGTRIPLDSEPLDALEIRPIHVTGTVLRRPVAALAEVETIARLAEAKTP